MDTYDRLKKFVGELGGVVVGYSGGVDSTLVARAATDALGERAVCVIVESCLNPIEEIEEAVRVADAQGFNLLRLKADALAIDHVSDNPPDRCYYCKKAVFSLMADTARERGLGCVLDGANADDASDYRPGTKATAELGVRSPLKELGITKAEVRAMSRTLGLPTWDKPSYACLASRVPYGETLSEELFVRIASAEAAMRRLGFRQVRVRHHGPIARIEVPIEDIDKVLDPDIRERAAAELKALGYSYVALDLDGYRTGSLNAELRVEN